VDERGRVEGGGHAEDRAAVEYGGDAPTVEVTVYRRGEVIHRELCEAGGVADVVDRWNEMEGVEVMVDDLSVRHRDGDILEPGPDPELPEA
jgi:hypothetical protein